MDTRVDRTLVEIDAAASTDRAATLYVADLTEQIRLMHQ